MKKVLGLTTLAVLGISLFPSFPANAQFAPSGAANDIICRFRHRSNDGQWRTASVSGSTRLGARNAQSKDINYLKNQAAAAGSELEVIHLGCGDPFGND